MKRKVLGRGLSALIPESKKIPQITKNQDFFMCPIEKIAPSGTQPRKYFDEEQLKELVSSIKKQGLIQPIIVKPLSDGSFSIVAGERRWRAAQKAGLHDVPVFIRNISALESFEMALVENLQRQDLNPIEEAEAFDRLITEHKYTQDQLAERIGKDRTTITNSLRLLKLPQNVQQELISGAISSGHARALLGITAPHLVKRALKEIVDKELSVRQTEALANKLKQETEPQKETSTPQQSPNVKAMEKQLSQALQTRVRLHTKNGQKGRIEIAYSSLDEFERILGKLLD